MSQHISHRIITRINKRERRKKLANWLIDHSFILLFTGFMVFAAVSLAIGEQP